MPRLRLRAPFALVLLVAAAPTQDGSNLFTANCAACHLVDRAHVGPSLIEIANLYRGKPDPFLAWCKAPQQKRQGVIAMPPMVHVGDANLMKVLEHILTVTEGKTEIVVDGVDRYRASPSMRKRPQVLRTFLPNCGPAAIAVAVDERWSYCFDAGACRLRYVWTGDFVDAWPVWRGNGDGLARIVGDVVLREEQHPLQPTEPVAPRFLGYRLEDGVPTFRYRLGEVELRERITVTADGSSLQRRFELSKPLAGRWSFVGSAKLRYVSEDGTLAADGTFVPKPGHELAFTVTMQEGK
jgi:cytochrome c551/c552